MQLKFFATSGATLLSNQLNALKPKVETTTGDNGK